ncbi:aldo/keto reductase [Phenylobacterium sp.]|uniref:aldo/keto reductase n=1 Tax=Phenylobacterium sp. TaxID=1871053 RepID=UPI0025F35E92|nr:aldo/keto reductase [Phenylobacterium sp.]MBX3484115.1 aldo/keto reductase [Phenylobacterium sp.]
MDYVKLGATGLTVSRVCLGCLGFGSPDWMPWILDEAASRPVLKAAVEAGVTFFDTADMYSLGVGEQVVGRVLGEMVPRDEIVIASKVFFPQTHAPGEGGLSRKHIMKAVDRSLRNLGTDYIDLYQIHRFDYDTPIEETLEALNDVVRAGKVRYIGASSMRAWQFSKMIHASRRNGWARFVSMQPQYSLIHREEEREMLPLCLDEGVGVIPWGPLAGGFLTGRYTRDGRAGSARDLHNQTVGRGAYGDADFDVAEALASVAQARGATPAAVALAWMMTNPAVTAPVIGANKPGHLQDALAALDLPLSREEIDTLERPYRPKAVTGLGREDLVRVVQGHRATIPPAPPTAQPA